MQICKKEDVIERWDNKLKVKGTFTYVVEAQQKHNLELRSLFNSKVQREGGKWS